MPEAKLRSDVRDVVQRGFFPLVESLKHSIEVIMEAGAAHQNREIDGKQRSQSVGVEEGIRVRRQHDRDIMSKVGKKQSPACREKVIWRRERSTEPEALCNE